MKGNSGKSSFFKWLYLQNSDLIGRITFGSSSQLRSIITKLGPKKIYIIDLLSAIEDLKTGFVINSMYGEGRTLIMEPHI